MREFKRNVAELRELLFNHSLVLNLRCLFNSSSISPWRLLGCFQHRANTLAGFIISKPIILRDVLLVMAIQLLDARFGV